MGWLRVGTRNSPWLPSDDTVYVELADSQGGPTGAPPPVVAMSTRSMGGEALGQQGGVDGGTGTNTIGLLTRTSGTVTNTGSDPYFILFTYFYLDDGAAVPNDSSGPIVAGVKCYVPSSLGSPAQWDFVTVTGVSGRQYDPATGKMNRILWVSDWF
jgi:hypothetical protein